MPACTFRRTPLLVRTGFGDRIVRSLLGLMTIGSTGFFLDGGRWSVELRSKRLTRDVVGKMGESSVGERMESWLSVR